MISPKLVFMLCLIDFTWAMGEMPEDCAKAYRLFLKELKTADTAAWPELPVDKVASVGVRDGYKHLHRDVTDHPEFQLAIDALERAES
jgi:hypothetical protein